MKKIALALVTATVFLAFFYKQLATYILSTILTGQGVAADFEIKELSFARIHLQEVRLAGETYITDISYWPVEKRLELEADKIDIDELMKLVGGDSEPITQTFLDESCTQIKPYGLKIEIGQVLWKEKVHNLNAKLTHERKSDSFQVSFAGMLKGSIEAVCKPNEILLKPSQLGVESPVQAKLLRGQIKVSDAKILTDLQASTSVEMGGLKINFKPQIKLSNVSLAQPMQTGQYLIEAFEMEVQKDERLFKPSYLEIKIKPEDLSKQKVKGYYEVLGIKIFEKGEVALQDINIEGELNLAEKYTSTIKITDADEDIELKGNILYDQGKIKVDFDTKAFVIDSIKKKIPELAKDLQTSLGKLDVAGKFEKFANENQLEARIKGEDVSLKTEFLNLVGAQFDHKVLNLFGLSSEKHRLYLKELTYGPTLEDFELWYEVKNKDEIAIHSFQTKMDGAELKTESFNVFPNTKKFTDFDLKITNYSLEKFLQFMLKESAKAEGRLDGQLKVGLVDEKPVIKIGKLSARDKGWIKVRTPGASPPDYKNVSFGSPVEILKTYLYDFKYETLDVDLTSDTDYRLKMTLRALGHNPQYLNGKRLKLKVNVEYGILEILKVYIMLHRFPDKLKDNFIQSLEK